MSYSVYQPNGYSYHDFIYKTSHDLRGPMGKGRSIGRGSREKAGPGNAETLSGVLERMTASGHGFLLKGGKLWANGIRQAV